MPRPLCPRVVSPGGLRPVFKPAGIPSNELDLVELSLDELEALRLADYEGLYQAAAARKMEISRQTFGRIVESARRKVTDALLNQKALRIEGGQIRHKTPQEDFMKIALPTINGMLDGHFGHCQYFTLFTIEKGAIVSEERVDSPAGCGCKSDIAATLAGKGASILIAGGIGEGAIRILAANGLKTVRGASGAVRKVAEQYARGQLIDSGEPCREHAQDCAH